jgi:hypothetical protein
MSGERSAFRTAITAATATAFQNPETEMPGRTAAARSSETAAVKAESKRCETRNRGTGPREVHI